MKKLFRIALCFCWFFSGLSIVYCQLDRQASSSFTGDWQQVTVQLLRKTTTNLSDNNLSQEVRKGTESWRVLDDSILRFEYPCAFIAGSPYILRSDSIFLSENQQPFAYVKLDAEVMTIHYLEEGREVRIDSFKKTTLSSERLTSLCLEGLNSDCLIGKLIITPKYLGDDSLPLNPPKKGRGIQKKYAIKTHAQAMKIYQQNEIVLLFNGEKKTFIIESIEWDSDRIMFNSHNKNRLLITIYPAEWWEGSEMSFECKRK